VTGISESILDTLTAPQTDPCIATRARKVVEIWNARSELFFYPTIRAAITAECPWRDYMCPDLLPDW
jgi:hypothetical protein